MTMPLRNPNTKDRAAGVSKGQTRGKSKLLAAETSSKTTAQSATTTSLTSLPRKRKPLSDDAEEFDTLKHKPRDQKRPKTTQTPTTARAHSTTLLKAASGKKGKVAKVGSSQPRQASAPAPILNSAPTQVLTVLVFGSGDCGELGLGPKEQEAPRARVNQFLDSDATTGFKVVQLDCGGMHVIALTRDNKIITWGVNDKGALGRNTTWNGATRDIDAESSDDDSDNLNPLESTPAQVPADSFPPGTNFVQVAAGDSCSLVLTDAGNVYGWGTFLNQEGKEGFGYDTNKHFTNVQSTPRLVPGLKNITQIACGANHAIALDSTGNIWAWGVGEQNQLGRRLLQRHSMQGFVPHQVEICRGDAKYIASGQYHSFAVDGKGNVWGWGLNSYGEAGFSKDAGSDTHFLPYPMKIPDLCGKGVTILAGGAHHSAAVTADGRCLVWGRTDGGQLGIEFSKEQLADDTLIRRDGRNNPRICLRPTVVPHIGEAAYVSCGTDHTIFISKEGKAYGSGFGTMGQLGNASSDDVEVAQLITGKALKERVLSWAGAGGQFSMVAGPAQITNGL